MGSRVLVFLLLVFIQACKIAAVTNTDDYTVLSALKNDWGNTPPSWEGSDPCGSKWEVIQCANSRVIAITLSSMGLTGGLSGDISSLSELQILDLSYNKGLKGSLPPTIGSLTKLTNLILVGCSFSGLIPDSIGSLAKLRSLSLNSNSFSGRIPASLGNLLQLYWLDLADNQLEGSIPVSDGTKPGLDLLVNTKHFHFGENKLSGEIPPQLFSSNMTLIHVLFDNNNLRGSIPDTLGLVQYLEVVRLDRNSLTGSVPSNLNNLTHVSQLRLSNNKLTGPLPNLTGMSVLSYLDMSNNSFYATDFPSWFPTLQSLTTIMMEQTQLRGSIPANLFSIPNLQTVIMSHNLLNGSLSLGTSYSNQLQLVDLTDNEITEYTPQPNNNKVDVRLVSNTVCQETGITASYCTATVEAPSSYTTPANNCVPVPCKPNQIASPNCKCAYPYTGLLVFRAPSFSDLGNLTIYASLETSILDHLTTLHLPVDSISLSNPRKDSSECLDLNLTVFPSGQEYFNRTGIAMIGFVLSNQTYKPPKLFGPYSFSGFPFQYFAGEPKGSSKSSSGIIIGAAAGGSALVLLLLLAGLYGYRQKMRAERATEQSRPFVHWDSNKTSGGVPQLKGARCFSFDELKKCTNNFSDANDIGSGGYGKVYRGTLPTGELIAIKRAQQGSMQGRLEFKTELELLSRVHHKNVVSLVGFCFERGEQMLVYEFVPNGSLKDCLSGKTGIRLDWIRRLKVALGAARGLAYLHELANPPIIHRDIKSTNILLDERLNAKVADFGLSKPMGDNERGQVTHVTTQVKGTMGYLDPEYYMTQQLTEKSDVYSFGVLMLELITGRKPIERGKYIVREVRMALDRKKDLYNLQELLDSNIGLDTTLQGLVNFVDLAMKCAQESGADRPTMGEVVKEIENILQLAGLNPNAESASTSENYNDLSKGTVGHPYSNEAFDYSGGFPVSKIEPH